jgi:hypothetical protein
MSQKLETSAIDLLTRSRFSQQEQKLAREEDSRLYDPESQSIPSHLRNLIAGGTSQDTISGSPRAADDVNRDQ